VEIDSATHRALAITANNTTWEFIDVPDAERSSEQTEEMLRRAYAAAYHWARAEGRTRQNDARAEWLLSRVWRAAGNGERALHYAQRCLGITQEEGLQDFDLAYAYDALARGLAMTGRRDEALGWWERAMAVEISDDGDRRQLMSDISDAP
jgi:tetratricopeptide (TPR) repeat protein